MFAERERGRGGGGGQREKRSFSALCKIATTLRERISAEVIQTGDWNREEEKERVQRPATEEQSDKVN